ncbi:hypothetical protein QGP82_14575 [Leptothoe sp. LEGE 181152]|nr:hypothetical protein [Leptothoe sp. LEGE 181152]
MVYVRPTDGAEIELNNKQVNLLEDLEGSALSRTNESPTGRILWSVGVFVLAVGPLGLYIAGLAASPLLVSAIKKALKNGQEAIYLRKSANFAHLLKESELVQLTHAIGKDSVAHQLMEASQDGHPLTKAAQKYLELAGHKAEKLTLDSLFNSPDEFNEAGDSPAVDVEAEEVADQSETLAGSENKEQDSDTKKKNKVEPDTALQRLLLSPYLSRVIFGGQRTGKTNLVAVASSKLAQKGTKIYHINLLSYTGKGDEDAQYTAHCEKSIRADFSHEVDSNKRSILVADCIKVVQQWWDYDGEAILIFDEYAYAASLAVPETAPLLTLIADKLGAIASSGMKREHALWALSPSMVASELQEAGKRIKSLKPVVVAIAPGYTEEWQGQQLTFDSSLHTEVNRNFGNVISWPTAAMVPGESRIAWIDGSWCGLGSSKKESKKKEDSELVELLAKIANEIKKQTSQKKKGHITVRDAAQFIQGSKRKEYYPKMPEYCQALASMYPSEFKVFQGIASEWRVAYLKSPNYKVEENR